MPIHSIIIFFFNHGLLKFTGKPQWRTILNGSKSYVQEFSKKIKGKILLNEQVIKVQRGRRIYVKSKNYKKYFDKVIFALHSDDILKVIEKPSKKEKLNFFQLQI